MIEVNNQLTKLIKNARNLINSFLSNGYEKNEALSARDEEVNRIIYFKHIIEDCDAYRNFYVKGKRVALEADLQRMFKLVVLKGLLQIKEALILLTEIIKLDELPNYAATGKKAFYAYDIFKKRRKKEDEKKVFNGSFGTDACDSFYNRRDSSRKCKSRWKSGDGTSSHQWKL